MRVLGLDTSTEYCSVALWQDGLVEERSALVGQKHSESLIGMLDRILRDAGLRIGLVDGIAFGKGPGSFTGIRIACSVSQGLALGVGLPVIGVCTLEAVAIAANRGRVIATLDARMGQVYHAAYEKRGNNVAIVTPPCLCKPSDVPPLPLNGWFGAGSGFASYEKILEKAYCGQMVGIDGAIKPSAAAIAALGAERLSQGYGVDAAQALPLYVRDKVALKTVERGSS